MLTYKNVLDMMLESRDFAALNKDLKAKYSKESHELIEENLNHIYQIRREIYTHEMVEQMMKLDLDSGHVVYSDENYMLKVVEHNSSTYPRNFRIVDKCK